MKSYFLPLNMQFFNSGEENPPEGTQVEGTPPEGQGEKTYTDADVQKLVSEKLAEAEISWNEKLEAAKTEAEKLAKLSKEEKEAHEEQKRIAALEEREAAVAKRELESETVKLLAEKQIPDSVLSLVIGTDAESTKKNIDTFKTVFDTAVQKAVEARMSGRTPKTGSGSSATKTDDIRSQFKNALGGK